MKGFEHYVPKEHLSPSSICNFARCPRRFFYANGCNLCSKSESPALLFGEAIHNGLPWAYRGDLNKAFEAFSSIWNEDIADDKRNKTRARAMFQHFSQTVPRDLFKIMPPLGLKHERVSQDETIFAVDIGAHLPFAGRLDAIVKHRDTGNLWALEYKTSSQLGSMFMSGFDLNPQLLSYALALHTMVNPSESSKVEGAVLIGLLVAKKSVNTVTLPIKIREHILEEFVQWLRLKAEELKACEDSEFFPKNPSMCTPYSCFGSPGLVCDYQMLCLADDWTKLKEFYSERAPHTIEIPEISGFNE